MRRLVLAGLTAGMATGLLLSLVISVFLGAPPSSADSSSADTGAVSVTSTATRTEMSGGTSQVVDSRSITLNVSQTTNLQGRQEVQVSWSGAHPTGGVVSDQNSAGAQYEEYPFVLLECRGVDSSSVARGPAAHPADVLDPDVDRALPGQPR